MAIPPIDYISLTVGMVRKYRMRELMIRMLILFVCLGYCIVTQANTLMSVFHDALNNDPVYKAAEARWLAGQEELPIQRSAFLPQFSIDGSYDRVHTDQDQSGELTSRFAAGTVYSNNGGYTLNLTQTLFNYQSWARLAAAKYSVKQAAAEYSQAAQDIIFRTARAYFDVLKADAVLRADVAERRHLYSQLQQTRNRYEVGVDDVAKLDETRSRYERAVAAEITGRNNLATKMEDLRAITGKAYTHLNGLGQKVPLATPRPRVIQKWVNLALRQNFNVQSKRYAALAARENIKSASGERYPDVQFEGTYTRSRQSKTLSRVPLVQRIASFGVKVNMPVYQGGRIWGQSKQAQYQYQQANDELDGAYRQAMRDTRQAYLQIVSRLGNVKADQQTIKAAKSALRSSKAAYRAGTRTFVDVLDRQSEYYQALRQYADDRYEFLIASLQLKQATGVLSFQDLRKLNGWLSRTFDVRARVLKNGRPDGLFQRIQH